MAARPLIVGAIAISGLLVTACGDSGDATEVVDQPDAGADGEFCEAMEHLIVLLAPSGPTDPAATEAGFTEAAGWFEQASRSAPAAIADDVAIYASSYLDYIVYLDEVAGYNLDVVFSTEEGRDLAIETSHSISPPIVEYTINECGLEFTDGPAQPPPDS